MFFLGVVESNEDPKKEGRLKIRIFGLHTDNRGINDDYQNIDTDDLPWAYPANPINSGAIDGIGEFTTVLTGTRVAVFFMDKYQQVPFYFAKLNHILDEMPDFRKGFSDPNKEHPSDDYKGESSIPRLARNEKIDETIVKTKNENKTTWNHNGNEIKEPDSAYAAGYPHNRVIETKSGIIIELDDTEDNERIHIYHPSHSYIEIDKDGNKVSKIQKKDYEIVLDDKDMYVDGNLRITAGSQISIFSNGDTLIKSEGNTNIDSSGTTSITSDGNITLEASGNITATGNIIDLN